MPPGYYLCMGLATASCLGVVFKNMAVGLFAVCISIGVVLDAMNYQKNKEK